MEKSSRLLKSDPGVEISERGDEFLGSSGPNLANAGLGRRTMLPNLARCSPKILTSTSADLHSQWLFNSLLGVTFSLLTSHFSLLTSHFSLLTSHFSLASHANATPASARTPTGNAPSSAKKYGEWLRGAVAASCPRGTMPRKK